MKIDIFSPPLLDSFVWGNISKKYLSKVYHIIEKPISFLFVYILLQFVISETSAQNFFPLKVGNAYQVKNDWWWVGSGGTGESGTDYYYLKVIRDTVINGQLFFSLLSNYDYPPFKPEHLFRYDSLQQKLILITNDTTTRLAVDFNAPADSHYISYITGSPIDFISRGISSQIVMGDTQLVYLMEDIELPRNSYKFATEIGLIQYKFYHAYFPPGYAYSETHNTISAIIDSFIYNPLVLSVDSLYPTFDRPVDTFPYLLTITYSASYSAFVDSFYLDVVHFRSDTLVQTKKYFLPKNNPSQISLYLDGLLSEDKIKLRATITDTSLYYNTDVYPDTGWVVMNVLPPTVNVENGNLPGDFELLQNYPNPFNPITTISYQIPEPAFVIIKVYDVLGNEIETLTNEAKYAGSYDIDFDGSGLTSGIYYYRITTGDFSQTKKMVLIK